MNESEPNRGSCTTTIEISDKELDKFNRTHISRTIYYRACSIKIKQF